MNILTQIKRTHGCKTVNNVTCRYLESQYVSGPYLAWVDKHKFLYLYHNVGGDLVSPPLGMRSSVPLGGKSSRIGAWYLGCPPSKLLLHVFIVICPH